MRKIWQAILWVWQLPQHLLGLFMVWMYGYETRYDYLGAVVHVCRQFPSGISLGRYIIVKRDKPVTVAHEYGHTRQSRMLGPLYLPVVGLWSAIRAGFNLYPKYHYYDGFPEAWADRLGGVHVDENGTRYA